MIVHPVSGIIKYYNSGHLSILTLCPLNSESESESFIQGKIHLLYMDNSYCDPHEISQEDQRKIGSLEFRIREAKCVE